MTGSLVQASQVTVEVEDAGFAERGLWETQPTQPTAPTNNVACSSGLTAVKFGAGVICAQSADGDYLISLSATLQWSLLLHALLDNWARVLVNLIVVTLGHDSAALYCSTRVSWTAVCWLHNFWSFLDMLL